MKNWKADILMVDDEPRNVLALEASLEPLGQNLLRAQSGEEALRLVLKHNLAVILLDVRMPGMDGFDTARMIRLRERSRHTPIIFLTGVSTEMESAFRGYEVGALDYLIKPATNRQHAKKSLKNKKERTLADPFLCWSFRLKWSTDRNSLRSSRETDDETGHEQHQKDEENDLRYRKGAGGDAAEPENARDDGDHKKYHSVIKHY